MRSLSSFSPSSPPALVYPFKSLSHIVFTVFFLYPALTMSQRTIIILSFTLFVTGLLWGVYSLIMYIGMPVHQLVYLSPNQVELLRATCNSQSGIAQTLCTGAAAIVPFVGALYNMGSPLIPYVVVSVLLFGALLLWAGYRTGYFRFQCAVRPMYLVFVFLLSLWLIGTTLSVGTLYNLNTPDETKLIGVNGQKELPSFRRFYEPLPQVYTGAGPEALKELKANYDSLMARGCLTEAGMTQNGAHVYDLSALCVQLSMFSRVGTQVFLIGFLLLILLSLGRFLLTTVLRVFGLHPLLECVLSIGLGALGFVVILWALAVASLLQAPVVRVVFFGLPFLFYRQTWHWLRVSWQRTFDVELSLGSAFPLLVWLLISYLALNFLNVVRPFPIGWDDLGSYLNRPRLLASYGSFIPSLSQFQWEYLTSLGYLLFSYDSWVGSTFAMQINWMAGLLAVLTVYTFGRIFLGPRRGVLAAMCYYFLPMTGHFSFADMKIDNASFFTSALAVLAVCAFLFDSSETENRAKGNLRLLVVAGLLMGFSFAVKPTAVLTALMISSVITGATLGAFGFAGTAVLGFAVLQHFGPLNVSDIVHRGLLNPSITPSMVYVTIIIVGLILLAIGVYRSRTAIRTFVLHAALFILGIVISILPWGIHNMMISRSISLAAMLTAQDFTAPQVSYLQKPANEVPSAMTIPTRYLPVELKLDPDNAACKTSARTEELDRYWGFETGVQHYLTLPWRQVMNTDAFGYYVTLAPMLLLFPLLLLLPFFWSKQGRWLRMLFAGTFVFFIQWVFVANGIAWYGIGMFLGFALAMEALVVYAPDVLNKTLFSFLITMSIFVCLVNRFWQFDTQKNLFEYPLGKVTAGALQEMTIPDYAIIRDSVVERHTTMANEPYTYRIGTFISYFIPQNREIFPLADHQLNFFNCLNQEHDHALTLKRLKALGFNSIIFDTNTQTIEKDTNGSLHQKVKGFTDFANDPVTGLNILINDPGNGIAYMLLP
jgi:hypothetical protein